VLIAEKLHTLSPFTPWPHSTANVRVSPSYMISRLSY